CSSLSNFITLRSCRSDLSALGTSERFKVSAKHFSAAVATLTLLTKMLVSRAIFISFDSSCRFDGGRLYIITLLLCGFDDGLCDDFRSCVLGLDDSDDLSVFVEHEI